MKILLLYYMPSIVILQSVSQFSESIKFVFEKMPLTVKML